MFLGHYSFHCFTLPNYLGSLLRDHTLLGIMVAPPVAVLMASPREETLRLLLSDLNGFLHLSQAPVEILTDLHF